MFANHPDHYRLTDHAGLRMQQRHIPPHLLEMVLEYGRTIHARGATYKVVGRKEVEHFQRKGIDLRDAEGTWGEIVLESVLESSGLRKGQEYIAQASYEKDDGGQHRPDVVVNLPEGKHMVIDAKMSLVAYERYTQAESEADRQAAIKQHLTSVRTHIKGLSEKNYQTLYSLKSLDFVLLFIPVEPAFMLAVTQDSTLFSEAFAKNVLLVSPSTLLATLRTIANIWRQEYQNRNAQEIASQCAKLYDKFVGFVEDLEDVGRKLQATQKAYDSAHGKLKSGRGNLIRQAESFKKLGVKPNKRLPEQLVDLAGANDNSDLAEEDQLLAETM